MISGSYFDGITTKPHPCELLVDTQGSVSIAGVVHQPCAFESLDISTRVGNTVRIIRFADKSRIETLDNNAVDELIKIHGKQTASWMSLHQWESKLKLIVLATVITALFLISFITVGLPAASEIIAHKLPAYLTNTIAQEALEELEDSSFERSELSVERQRQLTELLKVHVPKNSEFTYQLLFRKSDRFGANALALPNGTIIVTDDLVALSEHDEELLSVLLHEIGHIELRHSLRNIVESAGLYAMYTWMTGDVEVSSVAILAASGILLKARYSRGHESEADDYSLNILLEDEINPNYFSSMMQKLNADKKVKWSEKYPQRAPGAESKSEPQVSSKTTETNTEETELNDDTSEGSYRNGAKLRIILDYLSSHPSSELRIETFNAAAKSNGYPEL